MFRYYGRATLHACDDAVSLRMVEIPGENVGLGRRGCGRVHCSTDLPDGMAMGWYHRVGRRMFLRSGYGCSDYVSMLSTTCLYTYDHTSSHPNLPEPYDSPLRLYLRPRYACARPFPADLACGPAFDRRSVADCLHRGAASVGSGPALEHQNRPHPSGGGDDISRPYGFSMLKNTRIASGRRRILPARTWGVSAVFLSNNHGQTIMVGLRLH